MRNLAIILVVAAMLGGCDDDIEHKGNSSAPVVAMSRAEDGSSNVSVNLPGFDAHVRLPVELTSKSKIDIDGVSLFPGSIVSAMQIGTGKETMNLTFDAPADAAKVSAWFQQRFAEKSVTVAASGNAIAGTTKDGDAFSIALTPAAAGHSTGTIKITDKHR